MRLLTEITDRETFPILKEYGDIVVELYNSESLETIPNFLRDRAIISASIFNLRQALNSNETKNK